MTDPISNLGPLAPLRSDEVFNWGASGEKGDRRSSNYGGPNMPSSMEQYLRATGAYRSVQTRGAAAQPEGMEAKGLTPDEVTESIGKTHVQLAPSIYSPKPLGELEPPPRQVGFAEGMIGGLVEAFTGALPGFLRDPLVRGAQLAGQVADVPLELLGHVPLNEMLGLEGTEGAFKLLPMTEEKRSVMAQISANPTDAHWYMAQYLRMHQGDYMSAKGLPQILGGILSPDATLVERALGVLMVPGQVVNRFVAGQTGRAQQILEHEGELDPALQTIRQRYLAGEFGSIGSQAALDRMNDEITQSGFSWSNDPFVGMLAEMITDPLIIAGMGTGLAVRAVRVGALAERASNISRLARLAGETDSGIAAAVQQVDDLLRLQGIRSGKITDLRSADSTYRFAQEFEKVMGKGHRVIKDAEGRLSRIQQGEVALQPAIESAARISEVLNSPFAIFGVDKAAGVVMRRFTRHTSHGMLAAFDLGKVAMVYRDLRNAGGNIDGLNEALGYALGHAQRSMIQNNLIKQLRTAIKDVRGKVLPADWMPDALTDPDKVIEAIRKDGTSAQVQQMETFIRRVRVDFQPKLGDLTGKAREVEYQRQMDVFRENGAQQLAFAGNIDIGIARTIMKNADGDLLSFAYQAHWGRILKDVEAAKKADLAGVQAYTDSAIGAARARNQAAGATTHEVAAKAIGEQSPIVRATIVGPRDLTLQQAEQLLKDIEAAKDEAAALALVNEAINTKEYLYQNVFQKTRITTDAEIISRTKLLLQDGIKNKRFIEVINPDELPANLKALRENAAKRGVNYEIGVAPAQEARWSPVIDPKTGHLIGYYPWMDHFASPETISAPTRFDVLRERIWQPVRAENILMEARRSFVSTGVRRWGLDRASADELFDAIRKEASDHRTTMRSFSPDDFRLILDRARITEDMKARLGYRGLAELTARALESDVKMVGVTTKLTGRMKTQTAHYGNFIGQLSEKIYPLIRFNLNPIFLIQEWIEPYFFNILRGVKLGVKYTDDDLSFHNLMDQWNMSAVLADGFEAREFMMTGAVLAQQGMGPQTLIGRMASKMPVQRVSETKKHNYVALTKQRFGQELHRSFDQTFPGEWPKIQAFFNDLDTKAGGKGNLSEGEVATRWYMNKGMYDPDARGTHINHYDGAIPDDMGRIPSIHTSYLAQHFGYDSGASMRAAVMNPLSGLDEWSVRNQLVHAGFTPAYAQRAWQVVSGIAPEELYESIREGYRQGAVGTVVPAVTIPPVTATIVANPLGGAWDVSLPGFGSVTISQGRHGARTTVTSIAGGTHDVYPSMKQAMTAVARDYKLTPADLQAAGLGRYAAQGVPGPGPTVIPATTLPPTRAQIAARARQGEIAAAQFQEWVELVATMKGISPEEYVARKFTSQSVWLGSNARMPYNAYPQAARGLMEEAADLMGLKDFKVPEPDDPRYLATIERARNLWPDSPHDTQTPHVAQTALVTSRLTTEGLAGSVSKRVTITGVTLDPNLKMSPDDAVGWTVEQTKSMADQEITGAGEWYPAIGPMFLGFFDSVADDELIRIATAMNEVLSADGRMPAIDLTDPEVVRQEVAARAIMAWGATQIQTSPKGGFAFILRAMDENVRGRRPDAAEKYAFEIQTRQIRKMMLEFRESLSITGLGAKLHDFIDSIHGNRTRTFMKGAVAPVIDEVTGKVARRKVPVLDEAGNPVLDAKGRPKTRSEVVTAPYRQTYTNHHGQVVDMEPAAMDIWMGRARGLVDKETINYLADRLAVERGISRKEAQLAVQQELNIWIDKVPEGSGGKQAWTGSPTPEEYESMLLYYNRLKDHLNEMEDGNGWLNKQWSVADIQAVEWVRIQKALGIEAGGPTNMFGAHATTVHSEFNPGHHMALADLGLDRLSEGARDYVIRTVDLEIRAIIQAETGVTFVRYMPGWQNTTDGVVSANSAYTVIGHPDAVRDALHLHSLLTQQKRVVAIKPAGVKGEAKAGGSNQWGIDFVPDMATASHETMELLRIWLNGEARSTSPFHGEGTISVMRPDTAGALTVLYPKGKGVVADFETHAPIPDDMATKLANGTWIHDLRPDADPVTVATERRLHAVTEVKNDYAADAERARGLIEAGADPDATMAAEMGRAILARLDEDVTQKRPVLDADGNPVLDAKTGKPVMEVVNLGPDPRTVSLGRRVVDEHLPAIRAVADDAARRAENETWAAGRGRLEFLSEGGGGTRTYYQRDARGWRGATQFTRRRDTTVAVADGKLGGSRGGLYFRTGRPDVTTPVHEFFHFFADDLDPSAIERIHTVWWDSLTDKQRAARTQPATHTVLEREAEEWLSSHFEAYTATGIAPDLDPTLNAVFNAYADAWKVLHGKNPNVKPEVAALFKGMTREMHRGPSATFHVDHFRMMEAARIALQRAEEEAFRTHFYKRGRSVLERSINHPYLGLYPASYMWGKVLPELMRFLVKKPFGIDAPFAGMAMANHVWNAIQLEMNTDDGALKNLVLEFPELLRFLQLMIPGTPWDLPVNAPAWARRLSQGAWQGQPANIGAAISDTVAYAFGPGRAPADIFEWLQNIQGAGERAGQMLGGTYVSKADRDAAEKQLKWEQRRGMAPPTPEPTRRLQYGQQPQPSP